LLPLVDAVVTNAGYGGVQFALTHGVPLSSQPAARRRRPKSAPELHGRESESISGLTRRRPDQSGVPFSKCSGSPATERGRRRWRSGSRRLMRPGSRQIFSRIWCAPQSDSTPRTSRRQTRHKVTGGVCSVVARNAAYRCGGSVACAHFAPDAKRASGTPATSGAYSLTPRARRLHKFPPLILQDLSSVSRVQRGRALRAETREAVGRCRAECNTRGRGGA
jgi:hypothetical protein